MSKPAKRPETPRAPSKPSNLTREDLEAMVEDALADTYTDEEQREGFYNVVEDHLQVPFETEVLGVPVTVERVDLTPAGEIVAICARGDKRQQIPILDLPLPSTAPEGAEWIEAYRHWVEGG